ncbi:putative cysteine-rich receptor-like protein kinase 23 [Phoenix dactylifera]|uniref:Cysteine-rich receptor-like protein kinase 23 n=1 Tax=Phoenix dactylifera TaxID=42345 RepID=A0A8B7BP35_PHODC|nr:putative cysteine-rich receptor-like protein kinase 23 [Phoenix dactylifera]
MSRLHSKPLSFLLFASLYLLLLHPALGDDPINLTPVYPNCSGGAYTNGSAFQTNLNTLFSSLNSKSPASNFYNDTAGTGIDRVYGLFLCQGDLSHTDCQACIKAATTDILKACSQRQAVIFYDYCQLRYSDYDFFGIMDPIGIAMRNSNNVSDPERPLNFVSNLVKEAPNNKPLMFAAEASARHHLFGMAECTMDITSADCAKCLNTIFEGIKSCCSGYQGWRFLSPSCSIRYEAISFLRNQNSTSSDLVLSKCSDDELPSGDGSLQQDLDHLLSSLPSQARASGFYNTSVGVDPDRLYGLALCRADLAPGSKACLNCLNDAAADAVDECHDKTQAIVWHEKCLLRYSNRNFFGAVSNDMRVLCNRVEISEANDAAVIQMMTSLFAKAPESLRMFAAGKVTLGNDTGYGLVQCTRDLGSEGCQDCLREAMGNATDACKQRKGWRSLSGSCTVRYESYAFFNTSILAADAPAPAPAGKGHVNSFPPVKSWGSACGPNFMTVGLLCLLAINSMDGLGKW